MAFSLHARMGAGQGGSSGEACRASQVMPYSTGCCTPLSNFEAGLNYKDVSDPAVMARARRQLQRGASAGLTCHQCQLPWLRPPPAALRRIC